MKRLFSGESPTKPRAIPLSSPSPMSPSSSTSSAEVSPELSPIVTLLTAHAHRRYNEGVFMLLNDLTADGKPGDRKWEEVYGVLTGTQLAVWDANKLSKYRDNPEKLISTSSKPSYINFTDSSFKAVDSLPSSNGNLTNVIVVSTTLKNRYLLQYSSKENYDKWNAAFRLATYEYTCLQEAYTGALLSARGSRLSDIRVVLAETKYEHEDWVSVRFGSGMPWKRCYAVIEPSPKKSKKKFYPGKIVFYENEKKNKKTAMASVTSASGCYAVYPQTPQLIDHSTLMKLEGTISFHKNDTKDASVFLMPEQHFSVPGFDTIIRFLMPTLDAFGLYGRPKKLIADKTDPESLLFGLPVLPHVHYLELDDVLPISSQASSMTVKEWSNAVKSILQRKLSTGYTGCGSANGIDGTGSPLSYDEFAKPSSSQNSPLTPSFLPTPKFNGSTGQFSGNSSKSSLSSAEERSVKSLRSSSRLSEIYNKYSQIEAPSNSYNALNQNMSNLSLGKSKIDDDELPLKNATLNIFDPSFGDKDFNDNVSGPGSNESLEFTPRESKITTPAVAVTVSTPTFEQPPSMRGEPMTQRVLSPYSEFHRLVNQTVGVSQAKPLPRAPDYGAQNSKVKPLPLNPNGPNPYLQLAPLPVSKNRQQIQLPFQQRAPSNNIVTQQPSQQPLQQQPIRNLTPNGTYGQPSNPYGNYQRQPSPNSSNHRLSPVPSPAAQDSFAISNPYAPVQQQSTPVSQPSSLTHQQFSRSLPHGPRPPPQQVQQQQQQHFQQNKQPGQQQQRPHPQQTYPRQQYPSQQPQYSSLQQGYPKQNYASPQGYQQGQQLLPRVQRQYHPQLGQQLFPPQQGQPLYPAQGQPPYPTQGQQVYPPQQGQQQQLYPPQQGQQLYPHHEQYSHRTRKEPPPMVQQNPYASNPYANGH